MDSLSYWENVVISDTSGCFRKHLSSTPSEKNPISSLYLSYLSSREPIQALEKPFCPNSKLEISGLIAKTKKRQAKIHSQKLNQDIPVLISWSSLRSRLPLKLSVHNELLAKLKIDNMPMDLPSIQYERLYSKNLACVNSLLCQFFWPGIDVKDVLETPELTVIVKYKLLVIGAGLISHTGYISHLIVHPDWQRCGIGTIILHLLINGCPAADITLHVSSNNPALILYNQFGFKGESFLVNFYDKYLPPDSTLSKHAFLLRLRK